MNPLQKSTLLLVDDTKSNIDVLVNALKDEFRLMIALSGPSALASAKAHPPDLILLDIMMPEMDGYEVIDHLNEDPATCGIPVIFVTAMGQEENETYGFELGAVDYIRKPFSMPIVRTRIRTHLALRRAQAELEAQNEALREAVRLREDIERMSRHDLKSPLVSVISAPSLMPMLGPLNAEQEKVLEVVRRSGYKMLDMINRSLDLYKMEVGTYELVAVPVELLAVFGQIMKEIEAVIQAKEVKVQFIRDGLSGDNLPPFLVLGDELLCFSMFSNLFKNAVEACPEGGRIEIMLLDEPPRIRIINDGSVPASIRDHFFAKYVTAGKQQGTGLGTYSAKLIAHTQGGCVELDVSIPGRTAVTVHLPPVPEQHGTRPPHEDLLVKISNGDRA